MTVGKDGFHVSFESLSSVGVRRWSMTGSKGGIMRDRTVARVWCMGFEKGVFVQKGDTVAGKEPPRWPCG